MQLYRKGGDDMKKSEYIKALIKSRDFTIKSIALKMGISQASLSNKLNGHRIFKEKEIQALLSILDMKYEDVFDIKRVNVIDNDKSVISINNNKYTVTKSVANKIESIVKEEVEKIG